MPADNLAVYNDNPMLESIARVITVEGDTVLLEPEPKGGCGGCASASSCGTKSLGSPASKLEARRFSITNPDNLVVGERIVIGIPDNSLLKAAITAYIIPLVIMIAAGGLTQWKFGNDFATVGGMVLGLALGLAVSSKRAKHLFSQGNLAPQYIRRARFGETCNS